MPNALDITGLRSGRLVTLHPTKQRKYGNIVWKCQCDCGNIKYLRSSVIKSGVTKSCGCYQKETARKRLILPRGESIFNELYQQYKYAAEVRNLHFKISKQEFRILTKMDCFYCGKEPSRIRSRKGINGSYTYNGVDRLNSKIGYEMGNCVPCCRRCNVAKNDLTMQEFYNWVEKVYRNFVCRNPVEE